MATWRPDPGEAYLTRTWGAFATGLASGVSGKRWFRDTERRDIQDELPGWPPGPRFEIRSKAERGLRNAGVFGLRVATVVALAAVEMAGSFGGSSGGPRRVAERENEVEDFPVMWAAPGTLARTLPWQLDPGRCPGNYRTHLVVTDKRFLVVGFPDEDTTRDEVLWETRRTNIARVERRTYSKMGPEAKVQFVDGSWCRLAPRRPTTHWNFLCYLEFPYDVVSVRDLTEGQRATVAALRESDRVAEPVVTRRESGNLLVEVRTADIPDADTGLRTDVRLIGQHGEPVSPKPGDI